MIAFSFCGLCGLFPILAKEKKELMVCYFIGAVACILCSILLLVRAPKAVDEKYAQSKKMEAYEAINGCSDKYVNLPTHFSDQVLGSTDFIKTIPPLTWTIFILTVINMIF